jgi:hypothetical protein
VQGLITEDRANTDPDARPFARRKSELSHQSLNEGVSLIDVVLSHFINLAAYSVHICCYRHGRSLIFKEYMCHVL